MQIEEYVTSGSRKDDIDLINELSTTNRVHIEPGSHEDMLSVTYRPNEIVEAVVDEEWDGYVETPVRTTVLIIGEDETIERDDIAAARQAAIEEDQ